MLTDRMGLTVRRFALEKAKVFKPNPAKFAAAVQRAEARGDAHVLKNLTLAAEKFATTGENAALGAQARKAFHDGIAARVDALVAKRPSFKNAAEYQRYLNTLEEYMAATKAMLEKPRAEVVVATAAKADGHAKAFPALEAVQGDLARARKTFEGPLAAAKADLAEAQRQLATASADRKGQAQAWVDRVTGQVQKLELEMQQMTAKPAGWVAKEQAAYDGKMAPLIATLAKATGEVGKLDGPFAKLTGEFQGMEGAIGGLKKLWWKLTQRFDTNGWEAARKRLGV